MPHRVVIISVDASTVDSSPKMDGQSKSPPIRELMSAVTRVQLSRYNTATRELIQQQLDQWVRELSSPGGTISAYFIQLNLNDIEEQQRRLYFNSIPTSFSLNNEQVDRLIAAGHELLRNDPEYQRFILDVNGDTED